MRPWACRLVSWPGRVFVRSCSCPSCVSLVWGRRQQGPSACKHCRKSTDRSLLRLHSAHLKYSFTPASRKRDTPAEPPRVAGAPTALMTSGDVVPCPADSHAHRRNPAPDVPFCAVPGIFPTFRAPLVGRLAHVGQAGRRRRAVARGVVQRRPDGAARQATGGHACAQHGTRARPPAGAAGRQRGSAGEGLRVARRPPWRPGCASHRRRSGCSTTST